MEFFKKYGLTVLTGVGVLLALIFYSLNVPRNREANLVERSVMNVFGPVLKPAAYVSDFFEEVWDGYVSLVHVHKENLKLREEIRALNERVVAGNEALYANQRLSRLLGVKETVKAPTLTASIVGEDISSWFRTMLIDRGSSSGLREGMAVIAADGIVGQIVKVSGDTARVLLLTDHASGIAATIQRSRARGVVKGKGDGFCSLEFTTREEDVKVGDLVVASGIGGIFMKGMPIGEVTMVKRGEYGIFQTVTIRPAVNTAHLEEVLVILRGGYE
ncbi:rod shape-determining protein MreC [Geobacter sp. SVR]|uniref:rod shape-determining protein MreC n=1 Tax=Geobacter sp. SVR TaxID=2495594 RepID=UPI00143EFE41|nr:rod shape-determining protein MreC [Geobacter sp. SVR]BCS54484.1 cell shape-determining protein MreC [Geobacter sp. SVR]GCF87083.1 cell shape-determining protein MreC [Geobacter sp. SVR]